METTAQLSWFDRSNFIAVIKIVVVSSTSRNYHPPHPVRSNPHTLPDSLPTAYYFTLETIVPFVFPAFKASAASSPSRNLRGIYSSTKGSTEEYWCRQDAAQAIALVLWKGLGLDEGNTVGSWQGNSEKVLLGIGGGHYAPRHMDIVIKDGIWVGHLLSGYSLPMEVSPQGNGKSYSDVGGMWKHSIKVSYDATKAAFPGGQVIAHLDQNQQ
uniref:D-aminoacyl-tRNA deacylase n=1 Tax=Oryza rufipogon TaxID=4529 RepID=A0A0E0QNH1_ORYRU